MVDRDPGILFRIGNVASKLAVMLGTLLIVTAAWFFYVLETTDQGLRDFVAGLQRGGDTCFLPTDHQLVLPLTPDACIVDPGCEDAVAFVRVCLLEAP